MDNKVLGIGGILMVFVAIIVALALVNPIASNNAGMLNTVSITEQITAPANGSTYTFTNYQAVDSFTPINSTSGVAIGSGNYTIADKQVVNGQLATVLTVAPTSTYGGVVWNVTYTAQPLGYVGDAGSRGIVNLILIVFALAIFVIPLSIIYKDEIMDMIGK